MQSRPDPHAIAARSQDQNKARNPARVEPDSASMVDDNAVQVIPVDSPPVVMEDSPEDGEDALGDSESFATLNPFTEYKSSESIVGKYIYDIFLLSPNC